MISKLLLVQELRVLHQLLAPGGSECRLTNILRSSLLSKVVLATVSILISNSITHERIERFSDCFSSSVVRKVSNFPNLFSGLSVALIVGSTIAYGEGHWLREHSQSLPGSSSCLHFICKPLSISSCSLLFGYNCVRINDTHFITNIKLI